jgi:serine/threonine protein kinase
MEERYEIRGKIGQGGLGAVYRGYDTRMNREVAIKRITMSNDDPALQEESTRQLIKEAGALASLQHPHIVTIYDVGADEDGPYVVMELISGKTLDELIERAPLTWADFRELALQTQEALIAAQELNLIHSDIKPSNLMLTWLPSGKFQMKIVDFGLATLTHSQSQEELEELEAVFGSIFFMAPEQFERVPLDARTDMYAMGCVYYQALTGTYPFKGETGHEVMVSHLHHSVIPIQEVRSDIPMWACDWIMWQINRMPADRPDSARHSLQVFLQNDKNPNPTMSLGRAAPVVPLGPRPRLATAVGQQTAAHRPILDPRMAPPGYVPPEPEPEPVKIPDPPQTTTAPQPLLPPEGSKPSIHTGPHEIPAVTTAYSAPTVPIYQTARVLQSKHAPIPKKRSSNSGLKMVFAAILGVLVVAVGLFLMDRIKKSRGSKRHDIMLVDAAKPETKEIPMSGLEFSRFLNEAANADTDEKQKATFQVLTKAKPNDTTDFDAATADFITKTVEILPEVREAMIREILAKRVNAAMVPALTEFARETKHVPTSIAILNAISPVAGDNQFEAFLSVAQYSKNAEFRKAAEDCAVAVIKKSTNRPKLLGLVNAAIEGSNDPKIRESLRLIQAAGGG